MKIIDLLNKIANGEEDRFKYHQFTQHDYCTIDEFFDRYIISEINLNLEIIEDTPKENNKIEPIKEEVWQLDRAILKNKINEIIDKINGE